MSTPFRIAFLLALASPLAHAQAPAPVSLPSVRLMASGHPESAIGVVWMKEGVQDGGIDLALDSDLYPLASSEDAAPLLLQVRPAQPGARVSVRQRSVSYLNLSQEGPHIAVPGTEGRGAWMPLAATPAGDFRLRKTAAQAVRRDRTKILNHIP